MHGLHESIKLARSYCCDLVSCGDKTPCECSAPPQGETVWCERHQCYKAPHWQSLCKYCVSYFEAYERGQGPGQIKAPFVPVPRVIGLGDAVAWLIRMTTLGLLNPCCSCKSRMRYLNKITIWKSRRHSR